MGSLHLLRVAGCAVVAAVAVSSAAATAQAGSDAELRIDGVAPFSQLELVEALRVRVGADRRVEVVVANQRVTVTVDGRSRSIVLGEERGPAAARVVALVAASLALDPALASGTPTIDDAPPLDVGEVVERRRAPVVVVAATFAAPVGSHARPGVGLVVELVPGGERWRWHAGIGVELRGVPAEGDRGAVRLVSLPLRGGVAMGGRTTVGASVVAAPYLTTAGRGDRGVLLGGGVAVSTTVRSGGVLDLAVQVGLDVMATEVAYRWQEETILRTGRVRPWLAIGATWEGGP